MNDDYRLLLELQDKDLRIFNLRKQVVSVPAEKQRIRHELQVSEDRLETAKTGVMSVETKINQVEMDIADAQERRLKSQQKSAEVKKNEEYRALLGEIERCDKDITAAEDKQLAMWEDLEKGKVKKATAQKEFDAGHHRIEAALKDLDIREQNCQTQVAKMMVTRDEVAGGADAELLMHYDRLIARSKLKANFAKAVVPIQGTSCGGCFLTMTPQVINRVKKNVLLNCENCGVFLYYE
jgi:predicted  nucleic acid-binding Zn-ribbon protein